MYELDSNEKSSEKIKYGIISYDKKNSIKFIAVKKEKRSNHKNLKNIND